MTNTSHKNKQDNPNLDDNLGESSILLISPKYGEMLSSKRESLNLTIEDVCNALKIRRAYINAFEQCNISEYPPVVYVKGFLRSYSKFLDLNGNDIIRLYQNHSNQVSSIEDAASPQQKKRMLSKSDITVGVALLLLVIFVGYWGWKIYSSISQTNIEENIEITNLKNEIPKLIVPQKIKEQATQKTEANIEDKKLDFAKSTDRLLVSLPEGSIIIAALQDTWLEIRDPESVIVLAKILGEGETYIVPRKGTFFLTSGDAGRTVIHYGPGKWGVLGESGLVFRNFPLKRKDLIVYFSSR